MTRKTLIASLFMLPLAIGLAACGGGYSQRRAEADYLAVRGEALEDAALTSKVASLLTEDTTLNGSQIRVRTYGNIVHLTGYVVSRADKARAENLAYSVRGVRDVDNELMIN
jgi:hyperosmotically inducible protein